MAAATLGFAAMLWAGEAAKESPPAKPEAKADDTGTGAAKQDAPKLTAPSKDEIAAKVDGINITHADIQEARRRIALTARGPLPNNKAILDQLVDRVLWQRHFEKERLWPTGADLEQAMRIIDADLRSRGGNYQALLSQLGMSGEQHASQLAYELAMRRLVGTLREKVKPEEAKTEFDAHTEWYDGSRVRVSQIFIDTSTIGNNPEQQEKAKKRIDQCYEQLMSGKRFDQVARDYSEGAASVQGGERGWLFRKGATADTPLIDAVWTLEVGKFTKPSQAADGWHILKVTDREGPHFTFIGCRDRILDELTRQRLEALLKTLKAAAKIDLFI